jgi:regulator of sigma E protease
MLSLIGFLLALPIVVIVHEFGHFILARWNGVKVNAFAIGFGHEIWGKNDKYGTRWKICAIPLGGYVDMEGQSDSAVQPEKKAGKKLTAKEKSSFLYKNPWQKSSIIFAGPLFNYLFAILLVAVIFCFLGEVKVKPYVGKISSGSIAEKLGMQENDLIDSINGQKVVDFAEIPKLLRGKTVVDLRVIRGTKILNFMVSFPKKENVHLGIGSSPNFTTYEKTSLGQSVIKAGSFAYGLSVSTLVALGDMATGNRSMKELGGVIKIAQFSGDALEVGKTIAEKIISFSLFIAMLSISIGLINLLPIPPLDGGQLVFSLYEGIFRKQVPAKIQNAFFLIGFSLVIILMLISNGNDIIELFRKKFSL